MSMSSAPRAVLLTLCVALFVPVVARGAEPTDQDRAKAESLYKVALIAIENHDWEIARDKLQEILAIVPDQPRALLRLAEAELNLGRPSAAKKALAKAQAAGLPESDRPAAEDLGPKIDYALAKQASETPTGMLGSLGWRVTKVQFATFESWQRYGYAYTFYPLDKVSIILDIEAPARSPVEQRVPGDFIVRDKEGNTLLDKQDEFTNVLNNRSWRTAAMLVEIPELVPTTWSEITVEIRSEGKLAVRSKVKIAIDAQAPSDAAVQQIAGRWRGKSKCEGEKTNSQLEVTTSKPFPHFTLTFSNKYKESVYTGRLVPRSTTDWIGSGTHSCSNKTEYEFCNDIGAAWVDVSAGAARGELRVNESPCNFDLSRE